ncbi:DNA mismatch repair endonuclease MutL [Helcococcus ovis]|uniref:DNA mismatch repair protein MutL n=3 Tax=Helcococcus ovis TaxID=72026 RepID=A0A4R9C0I0_9FIRM|nr:DNA mismatch repair endonuclease MutL [Helcococcus ovis]TFF64929.1 DNA mismatch repair endonuclease MutL [Helcococcus ovis]TFF65424.1 DNA mismatch repair endonuclease MutL [Helcococcus ovis]TFF68144.1 DNA mismatch repair endonuclease MutL [Helcococcus ovis]WNZ02003.1 DNA mismatch repair endonuclease MutL [Helcococcus ovis]
MIKILSEDTIQKIAAGEVIERPASIIKELVENSIDAKSTNIIVEVKNGGKTYIKVSDNGSGIHHDEIETAFLRHATSKINNFIDLYNILSMGFRGEALASIISVSKLIIKSKTSNEDLGTKLIYDDNKLIEKKKVGMNTGTIIEVFDLFKYIPVRQKFLSSDITETNKITHLMYSFAIGNPNISFTYIRDNKEVFKTLNTQNEKVNLQILFGDDFINNSIKLNVKSENYKVDAIFSNNKYYKGNRSMQYIYVNGRYIVNDSITNAVETCYFNLIPNGRFPLFKLDIKVDPKLIDINIHPNKQKIKFTFGDELIDLLKKNITEALYESDKPKIIDINNNECDETINFHKLNQGDGYKKILDLYKSEKNNDNSQKTFSQNSKDIFKENEKTYVFTDISDNNDNLLENHIEKTEEIDSTEVIQTKINLDNIEFNTTLFNKFLIFDKLADNSIIIIDIDYANQRIIYDREIKNNNKLSQTLLEPIVINLTKKEIDTFEFNINRLKKLGYDIDLFSDSSVIIRSIPYYLDIPSTRSDFMNILDTTNNFDDKKENYILKKAISLAAYKSKNITKLEANMMYKELLNTTNPNTSPSGKVIIYELDYDTFMRILK